jgi:hypothetical protein
MALWELPWNRLQKPLACPAKSLKTLEGVLNPGFVFTAIPKEPEKANVIEPERLAYRAVTPNGFFLGLHTPHVPPSFAQCLQYVHRLCKWLTRFLF